MNPPRSFNTKQLLCQSGLIGISFDLLVTQGQSTARGRWHFSRRDGATHNQQHHNPGGKMQSPSYEKHSCFVATVSALMILSATAMFAQQKPQTPDSGKTPAAVKAKPVLAPLNIKPGQWETTVTTKSAGNPPIPADMLNRLTPEQRARLEERMKAQSGQTNTRTHQSCITKEQLQRADFTNRKQCTWTTLESNSTKAKGSATCDAGSGMTLTGAGEVDVTDQEHITGTLHMNATGSGREMTTDSTFTSKWLGAACRNEK
jgi:hypothetical protein